MSDTVKIKIAKVGRKEMPSKFKEGETYNITNILDEISGRKGAAMGAFADSWKVGDTVEGIWEKRTWKDKDGFEQESWNIKNPNKKEFRGGGGGNWGPRKPNIIDAYMVAATLAPIIFKDKKVKLDDIAKLAEEVLKRLNAATPAADTKKAEGKDVDLDKEETPKKKATKKDADFDVEEEPKSTNKSEDEDEDEDDPF